jgi:hypothetical protein
METNQFFSLKRFCLLLKNDLRINYKTYLITISGAFLVGYLIFYVNMPKTGGRLFMSTNYMQSLFFCLFGLGVFVGLSFPEMSNKIKTSNYLMLPASTFEKFMAQFLLRFVVGIILFILMIWLDTSLARWTSLHLNKIDPISIEVFNIESAFKGMKLHTFLSLVFAILSIGCYLFSIRLYFKKNALVKTVLSFGVFVYLMVCLMVLLSHLFYPGTEGFRINLNEYELSFLPIRNVEFWFSSIFYLSGLFLLPLGYYKLKEKQV